MSVAAAEINNSIESEQANSMRVDLSQRLSLMVSRFATAKAALDELGRSIDHKSSLPWEKTALEDVFERWLRETIRGFEAEGQGVGKATINPNDLDDRCRFPDTRTRDMNHRDGIDALGVVSQQIVETYDFELLIEELSRFSDGLEARGLVEAADTIANTLGLNDNHGRQHPPKKTGRYWLLTKWCYPCSYGGYDYRWVEELVKLGMAFEVAEEDAGLSGLCHSMRNISEAFHGTRETFASRTVIGQGNEVDAVVFKEKLQLRFSHDTGDGLLAFVAMHASVPLVSV